MKNHPGHGRAIAMKYKGQSCRLVEINIKVSLILTVLVGLSFTTFGQDPIKVAPESYKLQLENAWVRVLRVHYAPHSKVPVHNHSRFPAAYVYLVDSGPVRFVHTGWDDPVLTRPATKAGSFRLSPTRFEDETHAVENNGDTASEFLRIEIKTEAPNRNALSGRFAPYSGPRGNGLNKVEFENSQLRVTRMIVKLDTSVEIAARTDEATLLVVLIPGTEQIIGQTIWLAPGEKKAFANGKSIGTKTAMQLELLRFDFKTGPK